MIIARKHHYLCTYTYMHRLYLDSRRQGRVSLIGEPNQAVPGELPNLNLPASDVAEAPKTARENRADRG